jgi:hypothetical protein
MKYLVASALSASLLALCGAATAAPVYTNDGNLADFTNGVTYATFTNFQNGDAPGTVQYSTGNVYTPTTATLNHDYRVFSWNDSTVPGLPSGDWILATFSKPESSIRVFPNIDHFGSAYDGFQYSIYGSNDGVTWTFLYDVQSVNGSGEPFTIGASTGTDPVRVNNVLTPGQYNDAGGGTVGYIADFDFGSAYKEFAFGTSTFAGPQNSEQELSAVASVPEPAAWSMLILGFAMVGYAMRRRAPHAVSALSA